MDLSVTQFCIGAGTCREVNPLLRPLEQQPLAFGAAKMATSAAVAWLLLAQHKRHPRAVRIVALAATIGSAYVAVRNARVVRKR